MSTQEVNDFLASSSGSQHPAFKFAHVGDKISGVISEVPRVIDRPNLNDGKPEKQMVLAVTTDDGTTFAVWVRRGFMAQAIQDALTNAGAPGLEVGGRIGILYSEDRDTKKPNPAKVFKAQYQAPAPQAVGVDADLL